MNERDRTNEKSLEGEIIPPGRARGGRRTVFFDLRGADGSSAQGGVKVTRISGFKLTLILIVAAALALALVLTFASLFVVAAVVTAIAAALAMAVAWVKGLFR